MVNKDLQVFIKLFIDGKESKLKAVFIISI